MTEANVTIHITECTTETLRALNPPVRIEPAKGDDGSVRIPSELTIVP